jgi:nitrogen fixation protein FixH
MQASPVLHRRPRIVTGRTVFLCLLGFFAIVAGANAILIRAATSTFGGLETENAYKAGLNFGREIAAARAQDALHWTVEGHLSRDRRGMTAIEVAVKDATGNTVRGLDLSGALLHPTDRRLDHTVRLETENDGTFHGVVQVAPGQWDLILDVERNSERVFRSKSRVKVR